MARTEPIFGDDLRRVSSGRWLIPVLAVMGRENGSRFGVLIRTLGMSRSVLSHHLEKLENFGWVARNSGHGHPLRPEYFLTGEGRVVAAWCEGVMVQRQQLGLERHDLGRWSLPVLADLHGGWRRFSELERGLAPITPRALSLTLGQMLDVELVHRPATKPIPLYGLTDRGQDFALAVLSAR